MGPSSETSVQASGKRDDENPPVSSVKPKGAWPRAFISSALT